MDTSLPMAAEITLHLQEYRFWSPILGQEALRISYYNERGHEYFCIVPAEDGKGLRELRQRAAERFYDAVSSGHDPGEVRL
jgi:hypothetical protein